MDHLESLRVFCTVVEVKNFTKAAQVLGLTTPVVSRSVTELEEKLGVRLFHRSTRHISTTEVAERFFLGCTRVLADLDAIEAEARRGITEPTGMLRLVAHTTATVNVLVPLIAEFKKEFPAIHLDIALTERPVDLVEEGYDLGILLPFMLTTDKVITRLLTRIPVSLVSSPAYIAAQGAPVTPSDLEKYKFVALPPSIQTPSLHFRKAGGDVYVDLNFDIATNNSSLRKEIVLQGLGLGVLPETLVAQEIREGRLIRLLSDYDLVGSDIDVRLAYSDRKFMPAKVRVFVDYAISYFNAAANEL
ncbi:DNA-binding transcriptional LysR family regulator [Paraburkholderia sp. GAS199]|uniref:LysR family transcriptional regulator n=1 Tax=Paraburkholderia sp. GAS199 TaxID=3035126 RepID=UPI003D1F9D2F